MLAAVDKPSPIVVEQSPLASSHDVVGCSAACFFAAVRSNCLCRLLRAESSLISATELWSLSSCSEYADVQLRNNEKAALNALNGTRRKPGIRLLQAVLGCMAVTDPSLAQDIPRILAVALRLARALLSLLVLRSPACGFSALLNAITLHKCLQAHLWEDSLHVARQIENIGPALSSSLVRAGFITLEKLARADPRELELPSLSVAVSSVIILVVLCGRLALLDSAESPTWVNLRLRSLLMLRR
ncbi:hypothetical protein MRX96_028020 [Rhipicephalus microplus]